MSTGRRLAKRSIIGTKVCAPGPDGLWYSGVISDVKTPTSSTVGSINGKAMALAPPPPPPTFLAPGDTQLNADTRYIVRFDFKTQQSLASNIASAANYASMSMSSDSVIVETRRAAAAASVHISPAQALRRNAMIKEFRESDLIGPGFRSIMGIQLQPGQRIFLTYNGREQSGDVVHHDANKDEVVVKITTIGNEEPIELKKRLDEVRLLESRRSARLADQDRDTDFARLADMGGDRRRTTHSIEVPLTPQHNSRKRPPSHTHECGNDQCKEDEMNECNAALILMNLHNSPHGVADKWLGSSPGSSSSASWSSGSASPPLSDDGHAHQSHHILSPHDPANARIRTTSVSTSDEGIVSDFKEERKKKLDMDTLERQILEKKKQRSLQLECDKRYEEQEQLQKRLITAKEKELEKEKRISDSNLNYYRCRFQRKEQRREFDLNDPDYLKKAKPMRVADDDITLGISSAQVFLGEDLYNNDRKQRQREQQRAWLDQQVEERKQAEEDRRAADNLLMENIGCRDKHLEDMAKSQHVMRNQIIQKIRQYNVNLAKQKEMDRERIKRETHEDDMAEIYNMLSSDMLSENPDVAQSRTDPNKKIAFMYRGMSAEELRAFRKGQEQQLEESKQRKTESLLNDKQWEQYAINMDRTLMLKQIEVDRRRQAQVEELMRANAQLAVDQDKQRKEALVQLTNSVSKDFYDQFNKNSR